MSEDRIFDIAVIGGGPAGYASALYGASHGLDIVLIEKEKVGGTCLHKGCIPAKELLEVSQLYAKVFKFGEFGIELGNPRLNFEVLNNRKQRVINELYSGLSLLLKNRKVEVVSGEGRVVKPGVVRVNSEGESTEIRAKYIVLCTGSKPGELEQFSTDGELILNSDHVLELRKIPESVVILGGGAIGCEFASVFNDFGTRVTIVEALDQLLTGVDVEVGNALGRVFKKKGIDLRLSSSVSDVETSGKGLSLKLTNGEIIDTNCLVVSVGRKPLSQGVVEPELNLKTNARGFIEVDSYYQTNLERVYAIGDVIGTAQLAHVAFAEAIQVIKRIAGEKCSHLDYQKIPWCIYSHPEVAFVGHSEKSAIEAGYEVVIKKDPFASNSRARILGETDGLVKVICEKSREGKGGKLLGVHMVGPWVTELLGESYLALNWEAEASDIAQFIHPHPSLSESIGETFISLTGRSLHVN